MPEIDMSNGKAEAELLELIRGEDSANFVLAITFDDGQWTVSVTDMGTGSNAVGEGACFAEAWFRQMPGWSRTQTP